MPDNPSIAFVYDRINKFGGAERVLLALHDLYPDAPIYTLVHKKKSSAWAKGIKIVPSFLNKIPFLRSRHELLSLLAPLAFETFNFDQYDLVVSITSESAKAIITKPGTYHLCYCLTPTRYLWSGRAEYQQNPGLGIISPLVKSFLHSFISALQKKDLVLSSRPDEYIAISKEIQKRIKKYYNRDSEIIYPSIDYTYWSATAIYKPSSRGYYLVVSRLVPYKKVDLVIEAFKHLKQETLKVVGTGSQLPSLKKNAPRNVEFLGSVDDQKLRKLYAGAKAVIFPQNEDFGLVPLEAQAAGTPIIAYKKGGALETIIEGKTGLYFTQQSPDAIIETIYRFEELHFKPETCHRNAQVFSQDIFAQKFSAKVDSLFNKYQA